MNSTFQVTIDNKCGTVSFVRINTVQYECKTKKELASCKRFLNFIEPLMIFHYDWNIQMFRIFLSKTECFIVYALVLAHHISPENFPLMSFFAQRIFVFICCVRILLPCDAHVNIKLSRIFVKKFLCTLGLKCEQQKKNENKMWIDVIFTLSFIQVWTLKEKLSALN